MPYHVFVPICLLIKTEIKETEKKRVTFSIQYLLTNDHPMSQLSPKGI